MTFMPPQMPAGTPEMQLVQMYRYLYSLSEQLNATSATLDSQATKASEAIAKAAGVPIGSTDKSESQYTALVSLVVKTANIVQTQMDKIVTTLGSSYIAKSEWGIYEQKIDRQIEETAKSTMETFIYDAKLESLTDEEVNGFEAHLEGFIVRGIIGFEEDGITPIIGIAIGKELLKKKFTLENGETYEVIDTDKDVATYTSNELAFWLDGQKVAYFNQDTLYVTRIQVLNSVQLGDWFISVDANTGLVVEQNMGKGIDISTNPTITTIAETIKAQANLIDINAKKIQAQADEVEFVLGDKNTHKVQKWFTFDSTDGMTIRRPEYIAEDGTLVKKSVYSTKTDEKGYHVRRDDLPEDILTADIDGVKASALRIGKMVCRETEDGGWIWMEA